LTSVLHFTRLSKALHWTMAVMILAMLFIGVGMVSSVTERYSLLVAIHRPLGIAILLLVIVRIINRLRHAPPPLPAHMQWWERLAAKASHLVLYALMLLQPLVGWAMLSAGAYPIVLFGSLHLCASARRAHLSGAALVPDLPCPSGCGPAPWPHLPRRRARQHDPLAAPADG
jgi:cytochrome b561